MNYSEHSENTKSEVLWNNTYIKNNNKTLYYKLWYEKGIKYMDQIFDSRHKLFFTFQYMKNRYDLDNSDFL